MILDKQTMFADSLAYDGSPTEIDLGSVNPGKGKPIVCFFTTEATLTAATGIQVLDAAASPADENLILITPIPAAGETIQFEIPSTCLQFVNISIAGSVSAGSFSSGIVMEGVQTAT